MFSIAEHSLLAIRGGSYNIVRNNKFDNPYYEKRRAEKLIEVYDAKLDRREPDSPVYEEPAYDHTKYNVFERNFFGYHPFRPDHAAQPSAMQFSGQNCIIRQNVYCNPQDYQDPDQPDAKPGGTGVAMRWGGSWDGWNANRKIWVGEGIEAGYVTGNRFFNNTFFGYSNGCVVVPADNAISDIKLNPPPMEEKNPPRQFDKKFEFSDNEFKNNIMLAGPIKPQVRWTYLMINEGKPVAVMMLGLLSAMRFQNNDFYATGDHKDELLYMDTPQHPRPRRRRRWTRRVPRPSWATSRRTRCSSIRPGTTSGLRMAAR